MAVVGILILLVSIHFHEQATGIVFISREISVGETAYSISFFPLKTQMKGNFSLKFNKINVTLKAAETIYEVVPQYTFFNPQVHFHCECKCHDDFPQSCNIQKDRQFQECLRMRNETTSCTNIDNEGLGYYFCPNFFQACCRMYFTANPNDKYQAVRLRKLNTKYKLDIKVEDVTGNENIITLTVSEAVKRFYIDDILVEWYPTHEEKETSVNSWYIRNTLMKTIVQHKDNVNEKREQDLQKIGWFQVADDGLVSGVSPWAIYPHIKINLITCNGNATDCTWNLKASQFSPQKQDGNFLPKNLNQNLTGTFYITDGRVAINQTEMKLHVNLVHFPPPDYAFYNVFHRNNKELVFVMKSKGLGRISIVPTQMMEVSHSFILNITNTSSENQFCAEIILPNEFTELSWVCVEKLNDERSRLCQKTQRAPNLLTCQFQEETSTKNWTPENNDKNKLKKLPIEKTMFDDNIQTTRIVKVCLVISLLLLLIMVCSIFINKTIHKNSSNSHQKKVSKYGHSALHKKQDDLEELMSISTGSSTSNNNTTTTVDLQLPVENSQESKICFQPEQVKPKSLDSSSINASNILRKKLDQPQMKREEKLQQQLNGDMSVKKINFYVYPLFVSKATSNVLNISQHPNSISFSVENDDLAQLEQTCQTNLVFDKRVIGSYLLQTRQNPSFKISKVETKCTTDTNQDCQKTFVYPFQRVNFTVKNSALVQSILSFVKYFHNFKFHSKAFVKQNVRHLPFNAQDFRLKTQRPLFAKSATKFDFSHNFFVTHPNFPNDFARLKQVQTICTSPSTVNHTPLKFQRNERNKLNEPSHYHWSNIFVFANLLKHSTENLLSKVEAQKSHLPFIRQHYPNTWL